MTVLPAIAYPNVTLLTEAQVLRLHTSDSGREITAVETEVDGGSPTISGGHSCSSRWRD